MTAELDKSPKRGTAIADLRSPDSPGSRAESESSRAKKSPRQAPPSLPPMTAYASSIKLEENDEDANDAVGWKPFDKPSSSSAPAHVSTPAAWRSDFDIDMPEHASEVSLVDEGDMVPNVDFQMDVTFDDEGLNTLERIFLLSKSEYPFHRAYVSRVLGDLLNDVDPCESVEYVLPLLSGFSEDDDESVKEAFASELQRILWYFYSTCRLVEEDTEAIGGVEYEPKRETMTVTSEGMQVVPKPSADEAVTATENTVKRRASLLSLGTTGQSSTDSSLSHAPSFPFSLVGEEGGDTPNSTVSDAPSSQSTAFSPGLFIMPHTDDGDPETVAAKNDGPLVDRPTLAIGFFTPLLGSLLLNDNPGISDAVRLGVVHLIGRLRGTGELSPEVWGRNVDKADADERRIFISQNGPHAHDLRPFTVDAMTMVDRTPAGHHYRHGQAFHGGARIALCQFPRGRSARSRALRRASQGRGRIR